MDIYETINKDGHGQAKQPKQPKQVQAQAKQQQQQPEQNEMAEELSLFLNELKKGPSAPTGGDFHAANEMSGNWSSY